VSGSYYAALPAPPYSEVTVRIYDREIEILHAAGQVVRRHEKSLQGHLHSREQRSSLQSLARDGPSAEQSAADRSSYRSVWPGTLRPSRRALYGLTNLARTYPRTTIEAVVPGSLARASPMSPSNAPGAHARYRGVGRGAHRHASRIRHSGDHRILGFLGHPFTHTLSGDHACPCRCPSLNARCAACAFSA
jgi:hypothetical protein